MPRQPSESSEHSDEQLKTDFPRQGNASTYSRIDLQAVVGGSGSSPIPTQREHPFYSYALTVNAKNQSVSFDFLFLCIPSEN